MFADASWCFMRAIWCGQEWGCSSAGCESRWVSIAPLVTPSIHMLGSWSNSWRTTQLRLGSYSWWTPAPLMTSWLLYDNRVPHVTARSTHELNRQLNRQWQPPVTAARTSWTKLVGLDGFLGGCESRIEKPLFVLFVFCGTGMHSNSGESLLRWWSS